MPPFSSLPQVKTKETSDDVSLSLSHMRQVTTVRANPDKSTQGLIVCDRHWNWESEKCQHKVDKDLIEANLSNIPVTGISSSVGRLLSGVLCDLPPVHPLPLTTGNCIMTRSSWSWCHSRRGAAGRSARPRPLPGDHLRGAPGAGLHVRAAHRGLDSRHLAPPGQVSAARSKSPSQVIAKVLRVCLPSSKSEVVRWLTVVVFTNSELSQTSPHGTILNWVWYLWYSRQSVQFLRWLWFIWTWYWYS